MTRVAYKVTIECHGVFREVLYELLTPQCLAKMLRDGIVGESPVAERPSLDIVVSREGCVSLSGQLQPASSRKTTVEVDGAFIDFQGGDGVCRLDYSLALEAEPPSEAVLATLTPEYLARVLRDGIIAGISTAGSWIGFRISVSYDEVCRLSTGSTEAFSFPPVRML